jgi:hypothetical protein
MKEDQCCLQLTKTNNFITIVYSINIVLLHLIKNPSHFYPTINGLLKVSNKTTGQENKNLHQSTRQQYTKQQGCNGNI